MKCPLKGSTRELLCKDIIIMLYLDINGSSTHIKNVDLYTMAQKWVHAKYDKTWVRSVI